MRRGAAPPKFLELLDQDPQAYFAGATELISTYLPSDDPQDM